MLAITGVAHVNGVELAVHTVRIVFAIHNPARNAAIDFLTHSAFLLFSHYSAFPEIYTHAIDK